MRYLSLSSSYAYGGMICGCRIAWRTATRQRPHPERRAQINDGGGVDIRRADYRKMKGVEPAVELEAAAIGKRKRHEILTRSQPHREFGSEVDDMYSLCAR